jgi:NadR type nicotinamide-nucleotide adenylyltransferase
MTDTTFRHGLVIGKFYPPHEGHLFLIESAAARCGAVTVLVMAARCETIALNSRVAWLRASLDDVPHAAVTGVACDVPVDFADQAVWQAQVAVMRAALRRDHRPGVDVVFSSEPYGDELAAWLGCKHVEVDRGRAAVPVSASRIRADLPGWWDWVVPAARTGLAARVIVVGAESTGTTTVARELARAYRTRGGVWARTRWVPEVGRAYTIAKWRHAARAAASAGRPMPALDELDWSAEDFDAVATMQTRREERAAATGSPLLVCDTDAFATSVWERRYLGPRARGLQPWAKTLLPRRDVYLLTSHEGVRWQDDGLREGELAVREEMTGWFADALTAAGHSWALLTGSLGERLGLALRVTDYVTGQRMRLGPAITDDVAALPDLGPAIELVGRAGWPR